MRKYTNHGNHSGNSSAEEGQDDGHLKVPNKSRFKKSKSG